MNGGNEKGGAVTPPSIPTGKRKAIIGTTAIYPLPAQYSKPQSYRVNGKVLRFKGGRARLLDALIAAKSAGVDRSKTWQWCANLGDTISALRVKGLDIPRPIGGVYVLLSNVTRLEQNQ
jgi:hypothetical protein